MKDKLSIEEGRKGALAKGSKKSCAALKPNARAVDLPTNLYQGHIEFESLVLLS